MRITKAEVFCYKDHHVSDLVYYLWFLSLRFTLARIKKTRIQRHDSIDYLTRYTLLSTRLFSIKLHHILSSDDECLHDHPWTFISILLRGTYIEESDNGYKGFGPGSILFRRAQWKHRLMIDKPVWSCVITFRKVREWGFWTKKGFIRWEDYDQSMCE